MAAVKQSEVQKRVVAYLEEHHITERLNRAVNELCKFRPEDPFAFLISELSKLTKPSTITRVVGREVLDSRGNPTVEADVFVQLHGQEQLVARAAAPSGASTGSNEAHELRDGDEKRYLGKGVTKAATNVSTVLSDAIKGIEVQKQPAIDEALCKADGTPLKTKLGVNALTAVSFAVAEAAAATSHRQLFQHFAELFYGHMPDKFKLPRPMVNILNGGKHAGGNLKIQEFLIVPRGEITFSEMLRYATETYHHLGKILVKKYGPSAKHLGDEGGYAPPLDDPDEALTLIEEAIQAAGYKVGQDIFLALDPAASEFFKDGKYEIRPKDLKTTDQMIDFYIQLKKKHPGLMSIEDGLAEQDYEGWIKMTARFAEEFKDMMLIGDDLYTTNTELITKGIQQKWCNALLLKVNQIGTISEAMAAAKLVFEDRGQVCVSHRSGETTGNLIADLAVGIGAQFIKTGATARGERVVKYNRLLQIEEFLTLQR